MSVAVASVFVVGKPNASPDDHFCSACGFSSPRWFGRCPDCGRWSSAASMPEAGVEHLDILSPALEGAGPERITTGMAEVDRVLGGGLVEGGAVLLAGEPGIGKSTLVLQLLDGLLTGGRSALLVTGEESVAQVGLRGRRIGVALNHFKVAASVSLEACLAASGRATPDVLVIDSIQTLTSSAQDGAPGSVAQVRDCAAALVRHAKTTGTAVVIVGHVTKDGHVAGPKVLEHVVDAVLTLEGERSGSVRLLRAAKNRFGSCDETGVFVMEERGLQPVGDPSAMLLADRCEGVTGSVVFCALEGTRPLLVEIQALVVPSELPQPRRVAIGVDARRLALLIGVMQQRLDLKCEKKDVFVAAAGGIAVREPAADVALCIALHSALREVPVDPHVVAVGEVGLGGEIRRVPGIDRRLAEAARLGFRRALAPRGTKVPVGFEVVTVSNLQAAMDGTVPCSLSVPAS